MYLEVVEEVENEEVLGCVEWRDVDLRLLWTIAFSFSFLEDRSDFFRV